MLSTERTEFDTHVDVLCAGFNVPATSERREAYWRGLAKMNLASFARAVEHALGQDGPDKIPTSPQVWALHRKLRQDQRERERAPEQAVIAPLSTCHLYGNRALLNYLRRKGGASWDSLQLLIHEKNKLCDAFDAITQEEPEAALELRDKLFEGWDKVFVEMPPEQAQHHEQNFARTHHA